MRFADIAGAESVKARLRAMADDGRMPHALLLEGPAGVGKLALARAFVQYLHCTARTPDGEPCGECRSCRLHESFNHIDTHFVFPVVKLDKMNTPPISDDFIDQWREFLRADTYADAEQWTEMFDKRNAVPTTYVTESEALLHKLSYTSHITRYKTVIWWLPERMGEEAANKLLKLIEEPEDDTLIVMVSDNPADILPTIYSRVQRIEVKRLPDTLIAAELRRRYGDDERDAMAVAHLAEGSMTRALKQRSEQLAQSDFLDRFIRLMRMAYLRNVAELRTWANELAALGRERQLRFYDYTMRLVRENFMYNFNVADIVYLNRTEAAFSVKFARFINERNVEQLMRVLDHARTDIAGNANGKIVNLDVAIKVILLLKQ